ncbi:lipoate--protein ligase [Halobacteriovorax sp. ZH4_bin.1]|uniref:lipoate--protein ligase n=1 Tax=unclassified Halobacteriovorax TaxID=2639665 RepID=UPI00372189CC
MSKKVKVFIAEQYDPYFNLATENWIFNDMDTDSHVLFLWQNDETVVIGKHQNPWTECITSKMDEDGVKLARRQSGGGAVFHDLGNTNFTFMSSKESYDKDANNKIITNALKEFGIEAYPNGRNDIEVSTQEGSRKISGSAFKVKRDRSFHHGTLLINTDLSKLANYLNPNKKKLESKGIKSARARVINLVELNTEINHDSLSKAIIEEFCRFYKAEAEVEILNYDFLKSVPKLNEYYEELKDWNWLYGKTPKFNHQFDERFNWGSVEVHLNSNKGRIEEATIFSDCLYPPLIESFAEKLKGIPYDVKAVEEALVSVKEDLQSHEGEVNDFTQWLISNIR